MAEQHRFVGRNRREVFAKVRQALGADAVIIDQRSGNGLVEVVASADFPERTVDEPLCQAFADRLVRLGFEPAFIDALPRATRSWEQLAARLPDMLRYRSPEQRLTGAYRFVGAPGVGKTTTIVKLLAEEVFRIGAANCACVTTDSRRLAGCEPLALAAELLGVEYREVRENQLAATLEALAGKSLVLIDTAGVSAGQPPPVASSATDILVVPAMWQAGALRNSQAQFADLQPEGIVLTHVDQADTLGGCFSVIALWGIALWWISRGPELPNDLEPATAELTRTLMLQGIDRSQMSATFA